MLELTLNPMPYQEEVLWDVATPCIGVAAGKGSGKTEIVAANKALYLSCVHRGYEGLVASPTYGMTRRNIIPFFKELNERFKLDIKELKKSRCPSQLTINWGGVESLIHLDVTIENHERMNGLNLAWLIADECDMARREDMELFAQEALIRCRYPAPNQVAQRNFLGAPELNGWMGDYFSEPSPGKKVHHWSMYDNYMLSAEYKRQVEEEIPASLREAWVHGRFIYNIEDLIYAEYDPDLNNTNLSASDIQAGEPVHVSFDINDGGCSVVIVLTRGSEEHVIAEWMAMRDVSVILDRIKRQEWANQAVICMDPACTQAFPFVHRSGIKHKVMKGHPEISWRVTAVQRKLCDVTGRRTLFINKQTCPVLKKCLLAQKFVNGVPDKKTFIKEAKTDISGPVDALGYKIYRDYPIGPVRPALRTYTA